MTHPKYVLYTGEDHDAFYVDGKLAYVGESYRIAEYVYEMIGVVTVQDEEEPHWLGEQSDKYAPADTLDQIDAYVARRDEAESQAQELEAQAEELRRRAQALRQ